MTNLTVSLEDEKATVALGVAVSCLIKDSCIIFLEGDLGAGKTTFSRGVISGFGHKGVVKSPTYTLIETYEFQNQTIHHLDLYRLSDPEELEFLGLRDFIDSEDIFLIEWPSRGIGWLPPADITVSLSYVREGRAAHLHSSNKNLLGKLDLSTITNS